MRGAIVTRTLADGKTKRYHCVYRDGSGKQRWKTYARRKDAEKFLSSTVTDIHDGSYTHTRPAPMGEVFDRWLSHSLEVRLKTGLLRLSTAKAYISMLKDRFTRWKYRVPLNEYKVDHHGQTFHCIKNEFLLHHSF